MAEFEHVPPEEAAQIDNIVRLTIAQLERRYPGKPILRGVHAKGHGCVTATFTVSDCVPQELQVGVFATPGRCYEAWIRFSNAAVLDEPDSAKHPTTGGLVHGSRGMAVKLLGVSGTPLVPRVGPLTQDFLMVNQPSFAFSNVEDYEVLSRVLQDNDDKPTPFFGERLARNPDNTFVNAAAARRAQVTLGIVQRVQSGSVTASPPAFQEPPGSPLDNRYFSAAPFLLGDTRAMKFSATPVCPVTAATLDADKRDYLREGLRDRLTTPGAREVVFDFEIQVRTAAELAGKIETEIEDASFVWDEAAHPFVKVATITIPPQDFDSEERRAQCENLFFTPWHSLAEHRPLGGINRMRKKVYEASAGFRLMPKEPACL